MRIPLINQLKKRQQIDIALLQDEVIRIVYLVSDDMVLHGGTAIWRCYSGKRFSEDIDLYSTAFSGLIDKFRKIAATHGLAISKMKDTGNVIFATVLSGKTAVRLEVNHTSKVNGTMVSYELVDGSQIEVLSLTPEQLINEKIDAYSDRRFVRDIYDIYKLVPLGVLNESTLARLRVFLHDIQTPVDESILKSLVYIGLAPSFERMINEIGRYLT